MRLLNVTTLELEEFHGTDIPKYAILSHTWGRQELTMAELQTIAKHRQTKKQHLEQNQLTARASAASSFGTDRAEAVRMMLLSSMLVAMRTGRSYPLNYGNGHHHSRSKSITDGLEEVGSEEGSETHDHELEHRRPQEQDERDRHQGFMPVIPATAPHPLELKPGFTKILSAAKQAASDGHRYLWADTICIDRTNGYEISEAINSMFTWYANATVCYAHLEDVIFQEYKSGYRTWEHDFAKSRWFTRGFTLQELVAPRRVVFFAQGWQWLGTKSDPILSKHIEKVTKIEAKVLSDPSQVFKTCIARRMAWASQRKTTRPEDTAYCLMGLFGVNMPLLYGEGLEGAFTRLQEEIIKVSDDHTLFSWGLVKQDSSLIEYSSPHQEEDDLDKFDPDEMVGMTGILAKSPADFAGMDGVVPATTTIAQGDTSYKMTNKGLKIRLKLSPVNIGIVSSSTSHRYYLGVLNCQHSQDDPSSRLGMLLTETDTPNVLFRTRTRMYTWLSGAALATAEPRRVYICQNNPDRFLALQDRRGHELDVLVLVKARDLVSPGYQIVDIQARRGYWNKEFGTLRATGIDTSKLGGGGIGIVPVVCQLAVLTFWNKHMRRGFHVRVLVDSASGTYFVDLCQPEGQQSGEVQRKEVPEAEELKWLRDEAKKRWESPGQIRVVSSGNSGALKQTRMVDIANPNTFGGSGEEQTSSGSVGWGKEQGSWEPVLDQGFSPNVSFTEAWEKEYMRTVRASVERKKDVVVLEVSSMLWEAAPAPPTTATAPGLAGSETSEQVAREVKVKGVNAGVAVTA
ncbi:vegetative incompatibility protein HET-E-1 [Rhypophila decipiens]